MEKRSKAVLIDLFGTLCGKISPEERIIEEWGLSPLIHDNLQKAVCGTKFDGDSENYYWLVLNEANIEYNPSNRKKLIDIFNESLDHGIPFPETGKVLEELKSKYFVALVSNSNPFVRKRVLEKNSMTGYFDLISLSCEIGVTKQNPDIYKRALDILKVSSENAIMVGDSFEGDIISSKRATGGKIGGILISDNTYLARLKKFTVVPRLSHAPEAVDKYFSEWHF